MKRLLIALGALTAVATTVAAEDFRPTGSVKQEIRWYGDKEEKDAEGLRFTMAEGGIRFTPNFYIDYRVRDYIRYNSDEGSNTKSLRTRLYYDHGTLGDTQITTRQRFGVESDADKNVYYYTPEFSFTNYFEGSENYELSTFTVRPVARYHDDNNANKAVTRFGADILTVHSFPSVPGDLAIEFNTYFRYDDAGDFASDNGVGNPATKTEDSRIAVDVELYAYYSTDSVSWNGIDFNLYYEFGMDPASFYDRKVDVVDANDVVTDDYDVNYVFYNDFELQASYAVNSSTSVYGAIAAEYANQGTQDRASDWKWQPYAYVGWRTKF